MILSCVESLLALLCRNALLCFVLQYFKSAGASYVEIAGETMIHQGGVVAALLLEFAHGSYFTHIEPGNC